MFIRSLLVLWLNSWLAEAYHYHSNFSASILHLNGLAKSCPSDGQAVCGMKATKSFLFENQCMLDAINKDKIFNSVGYVFQQVPVKSCLHNCQMMCQKIYKPVCGLNTNSQQKKLFLNKCDMIRYGCKTKTVFKKLIATQCGNVTLAAHKRFRKNSESIVQNRRPVPCKKIYKPVCGLYMGVKSTFKNECLLNAENVKYARNWKIIKIGICEEDYVHTRPSFAVYASPTLRLGKRHSIKKRSFSHSNNDFLPLRESNEFHINNIPKDIPYNPVKYTDFKTQQLSRSADNIFDHRPTVFQTQFVDRNSLSYQSKPVKEFDELINQIITLPSPDDKYKEVQKANLLAKPQSYQQPIETIKESFVHIPRPATLNVRHFDPENKPKGHSIPDDNFPSHLPSMTLSDGEEEVPNNLRELTPILAAEKMSNHQANIGHEVPNNYRQLPPKNFAHLQIRAMKNRNPNFPRPLRQRERPRFIGEIPSLGLKPKPFESRLNFGTHKHEQKPNPFISLESHRNAKNFGVYDHYTIGRLEQPIQKQLHLPRKSITVTTSTTAATTTVENKLQELIATTVAPVGWNEIISSTEEASTTEKPVRCEFGNAPVCAALLDGTIRTFDNICEMMLTKTTKGKSWSKLHNGTCEECKNECSRDYAPICVTKNSVNYTMINECYYNLAICMDKSSKWQQLAEGECKRYTRLPNKYDVSKPGFKFTSSYVASKTTTTTTEKYPILATKVRVQKRLGKLRSKNRRVFAKNKKIVTRQSSALESMWAHAKKSNPHLGNKLNSNSWKDKTTKEPFRIEKYALYGPQTESHIMHIVKSKGNVNS